MTAAVLAMAAFALVGIPWAIRHDQQQPTSVTGKARK